MTTAQALLSVNGISRRYGNRSAVVDVSFELDRGQVLGLLGPNGAGKTTTLQMLSGVLPPTTGQIHIGGHDLLRQPERAKALIGYLPEQPPLYLDLTVDEYLLYCARLHLMSGAGARTALERSKGLCGLKDVGGRLIANLSGGFQQRVGIAQALIHSPALIILDEPAAGLDPGQNLELRALIRELGKEHAIIMSTHILSEIQACCDRVQILHEGRMALDERVQSSRWDAGPYSVDVALQNPPAVEALRVIRGVLNVVGNDEGRFRIECADPAETPARIAAQAAASGWGLYELAPRRDSLETTYLRFTGAAANGT